MSLHAVDVVIVNWNSLLLTEAAVASIERSERAVHRIASITIVDNDSTPPLHQEDFGRRATVLANDANHGFGRASNQGAARGSADFILFLNPDVALGAETLDHAVGALADDSTLGVVSVALTDATGKVNRSCCRRPTLGSLAAHTTGVDRVARCGKLGYRMRDWDHDEDRDVDHVMAAFYLVRRSVFEAVQGFDMRFFMYLEDLDLSLRIRDAGHRIRFLAHATAFHEGGGTSKQVKATRLFYALRSRVQFVVKHHGIVPAALIASLSLLVEAPLRLGSALIARSSDDARNVLRAYRALLFRSGSNDRIDT